MELLTKMTLQTAMMAVTCIHKLNHYPDHPDPKLQTPPHPNSTGSQTPQTPLGHKLHCIHKLHYTLGSLTTLLPNPPFTANQGTTVNTTDRQSPTPPLMPPPDLTVNQEATKIAADAPQTLTREEEETNEDLEQHVDFAVNKGQINHQTQLVIIQGSSKPSSPEMVRKKFTMDREEKKLDNLCSQQRNPMQDFWKKHYNVLQTGDPMYHSLNSAAVFAHFKSTEYYHEQRYQDFLQATQTIYTTQHDETIRYMAYPHTKGASEFITNHTNENHNTNRGKHTENPNPGKIHISQSATEKYREELRQQRLAVSNFWSTHYKVDKGSSEVLPQ